MPGFSAFLGLVALVSYWLGGRPLKGLGGLLVMAAVGALFLFGSRSETLQGLGGPGRDERWAMIDTTATAFAGLVAFVAIAAMFLVEVAQGEDGKPYTVLAAVAGISYLAAVAWQRARR